MVAPVCLISQLKSLQSLFHYFGSGNPGIQNKGEHSNLAFIGKDCVFIIDCLMAGDFSNG